MRNLYNFALLTNRYSLFRTTISVSPTGFHFYKDQVMFIFGYKIDFPIMTAKVAFKDTISITDQFFCGQTLTSSPKSLTRSFSSIICTSYGIDSPTSSLSLLRTPTPECCNMHTSGFSISQAVNVCKALTGLKRKDD